MASLASIGVRIVVLVLHWTEVITIAVLELVDVTHSASIGFVLNSGNFLITDPLMAGHTDIQGITHRAF